MGNNAACVGVIECAYFLRVHQSEFDSTTGGGPCFRRRCNALTHVTPKKRVSSVFYYCDFSFLLNAYGEAGASSVDVDSSTHEPPGSRSSPGSGAAISNRPAGPPALPPHWSGLRGMTQNRVDGTFRRTRLFYR